MEDKISYKELIPLLDEVEKDDSDLGIILHNCLWPSLAGKGERKSPELWKAVDSKEYNRWLEGAKQFRKYILESNSR